MTALAITSSEFRKDIKKYFDMLDTAKVYIKRGGKYIELVPRDTMELVTEKSLSRFYGVWGGEEDTADHLADEIRTSRRNNRMIEEL